MSDRDKFAAIIGLISTQAHLAEWQVRSTSEIDWLNNSGQWLDDINCGLDRARLMRFDILQKHQESRTGE